MSFSEQIRQQGLSQKKRYKKLFTRVAKIPSRRADQLFNQTHNEVFDDFDCLSCANCCKTTSPIFREQDILRISSRLKLSHSAFTEKYLRLDEQGDYVLQNSPCTFLQDDNTCSIYEYRPKACREYPHTDRKNIQGIASLTVRNAQVCPATQQILERVEEKLKKG